MPHFSRLCEKWARYPPPQGKTDRALGSCLSRCFIPGTTAEIFPPDPKHRGSTLSESATASLARPSTAHVGTAALGCPARAKPSAPLSPKRKAQSPASLLGARTQPSLRRISPAYIHLP